MSAQSRGRGDHREAGASRHAASDHARRDARSGSVDPGTGADPRIGAARALGIGVPGSPALAVAVVGHVEWVEFVDVDHLPASGQVAHATASFARAAGGGGVVATVLAQLGADVDFYCALGRDDLGTAAATQLTAAGVRVHAALRAAPTRRAVTMIDGAGERTIVTIGDRLQADGDDPLDWDRLATVDGVYFTAGDRLALLRSRSAPVLVASPRAHAAFDGALGSAPDDGEGDRGGDRGDDGGGAPAGPGAPSGPGVAGDPVVDALLYSAHDRQECLWAQEIGSRVRVRVVTEGAHGGRWWGEEEGAWDPAPAPVVHGDSYGCGDSFAAGFTCALAAGATVAQAAALGGLCGAHCLGLHGAP